MQFRGISLVTFDFIPCVLSNLLVPYVSSTVHLVGVYQTVFLKPCYYCTLPGVAIAMCGRESWTFMAADKKRIITTFEMSAYRRMMMRVSTAVTR